MMSFIRTFVSWLALTTLVAPLSAYAAEDELVLTRGLTLADILEDLSATHGVIVKGLEKTAGMPAYRVQTGPAKLRQRLRQLLSDFNYVIIQAPDGKVEQVIILNQKAAQSEEPDQITLNTERLGNHHVVQATIVGTGSVRIPVPLLVDTGSAFVVLPTSMISALDLDPNDLEERTLQTANGHVTARAGQLRAVELGPEIVRDVDVAFIDDDLLGHNRLLGMSVLGRYRIIIDEEQNHITLDRR